MILVSVNKAVAYTDSKTLYHFILVLSFVGAVILIPYMKEFIANYVVQEMLQWTIAYAAAYLAATYVLPEGGFLIYRLVRSKK